MMIWDWDCSIKFCFVAFVFVFVFVCSIHPSVNQTLLSAAIVVYCRGAGKGKGLEGMTTT
jgi:hypothetical protein